MDIDRIFLWISDNFEKWPIIFLVLGVIVAAYYFKPTRK